MKLAGDIGGTKVLLALVDDGGKPVGERRFETADFADFAPLLGEFLRDNPATMNGGCLAVAGPVADDGRSAKITNLPWTVDAAALEKQFGLGRLTLINDFAAAAMGVTAATPEELVTVQAGEPLADGVKLVVGAGTGLGMATLVRAGRGWRVLPGEGGHVGFAPADHLQACVWSALMTDHGRVTTERVVSGPGLAAIHRILASEMLKPGATPAVLTPAEVANLALRGDTMALRSLNVFLAAYGAFAGDMAMAVMARGGVYLDGGIAAKILSLLQTGPFLAAFNAKAEHAALARRMPIFVATDPLLGLHGAAAVALDRQLG
jgi:glucokinase